MNQQQQQETQVDPGRVINALRAQVSDLSLALAMQTARAEECEAFIAASAAAETGGGAE